MKKAIAFLLIVVCCVGTVIPTAALVPPNRGSDIIFTKDINNWAEDQAVMLSKLGIFIGSDIGFELYRPLTRAEAGILLVRAMGMEKESLVQSNEHPFTDVPWWADKQIGWLYQNNITAGVGGGLYGSEQSVDYWQFATFLSRACSGEDDFVAAGVGYALEQSLCEGNSSMSGAVPPSGFDRCDAVGLLTRFLGCNYTVNKQESLTVAQHLVRKGVFSAEQLAAAGSSIYPIRYSSENGVMTAMILGVPVRTSQYLGVDAETAFPNTELSYFYTCRFGATETILYRMDCMTLQETEVGRLEGANRAMPMSMTYLVTAGGKDYLDVRMNGKAKLVSVGGGATTVVGEGKQFNYGTESHMRYAIPRIRQDNMLAVMLDDTLYVVSEEGCKGYPMPSGTRIVALVDNEVVIHREENGVAVIEDVSALFGSIDDTYRVPLAEASHLSVIEQRDGHMYGRAGLFVVRHGRLIRVTERPVLAATNVRRGNKAGFAPVILTSSSDMNVGDTIIELQEGADIWDWTELVLLGNTPQHHIPISEIYGGINSYVTVYSRRDVGMQNFDVYKYHIGYIYDENSHNTDTMGITVVSYTAGRPEMMENTEAWYVKQEQNRLADLGVRLSWKQPWKSSAE